MSSSSNKVIIDTGFIVALFNEKDEHHELACTIVEKIDDYIWYTTPFVMQEIFWIMAKRKSRDIALSCFEEMQSAIVLPDLPKNWSQEVSKILKQYASANIDMADASLVILADQIQVGLIASVDKKDFAILKWNSNRNSFINLLGN